MKKSWIIVLLWGLLSISIISGCEEVLPPVPEVLPEEEPAFTLETPVEVSGLILDGRGLTITADNQEYNGELFPVQDLIWLGGRFDPGGWAAQEEGWTGFTWRGWTVEILPGTVLYRFENEEKRAVGPSFRVGNQLHLHGSLLEAIDPELTWSEQGLLLVAPSGEASATEALDGSEDVENREQTESGVDDEQSNLKPATFFIGEPGIQSLINRDHRIPAERNGIDLILLNEAYPGISYLRSEMRLNQEAGQKLAEMVADAETLSEVDRIHVVSTYRSYNYQQDVLNRRIARFMNEQGYDRGRATEEAQRIVAVPGTSEHQSGLAVDFTSNELLTSGQTLTGGFYDTAEGDWLLHNSWRYGFILRYPANTEEITGIIEEAWHYRYVGLPHGQIIVEKDMVLETYMDYLQSEQVVWFEDVFGDRYLILYLNEDWAERTMVDPSVCQISDSNEGGVIVTMDWPW